MPPLPSIANVLRVAIAGTCGLRQWANIMHVSFALPQPLEAALTAYCQALSNSWETNIAPLQDTNTHLNSVKATDLTSETAAQGEWDATVVGTRVGGPIPASAAALLNYGIDARYRGGHPRTYLLAGVDSDLLTNNTWNVGFTDAVQAGWVAFLNDMTTFSMPGGTELLSVGCVSYTRNKAKRTPPVFYGFTSNTGPQQELATIRRRVRRAGHG